MTALSHLRRTVAPMTTVAAPAPHPWARAARRWRERATATAALYSRSVILDVETTDLYGRICEIAVIDTRGQVLLDTLVNPEAPIAAPAAAVHGITDHDVAAAPTWSQVAPTVLAVLAGRRVIAYNAPFDQSIVRAELRRIGAGSHVVDQGSWWCLMRSRAVIENTRWTRLEGGHRAAGDCFATLAVLREVAFHPGGGQP